MIKLTDDCFDRLTEYIAERYGMDLHNKRVLADSRLAVAAAAEGYEDINTYVEDAINDESGRKTSQMVNRLTTNHTYFMREPEHFTYMFENVLPHIEAAVTDKDIRIWCAGCSTGQEAYSMAMVIDEYFGPSKSQWDTVILATDLNTEALYTAREGIYPKEALEGLSPERIEHYFIELPDGNMRLIDRIKDSVVFKRFNLKDDIIYKKPFDLISCRNVMIYFDQRTKEELVQRLLLCTKPGGYLFTGHAENLPRDSGYDYICPAIFRKPMR
ncbi:MAG: protein-glutamate O-methyltransferase CheR [Oscillospiraceae bacterium]|nr:protein-glutamate O-methyltransferase CheR [Oscillospiraceae bacterium]